MKQEEKLSLLTELIKLATSDRAMRDEEYSFLKKIAEMLGIEETVFKTLFDKHIEFTPPVFETDRIIQFQRLVLLANIDMNITEKELEFLRLAGIRLGLHPDAITEVFQEMKKSKWGMIEPEKLIRIFQVYHN